MKTISMHERGAAGRLKVSLDSTGDLDILCHENGFVLVLSMMILVVLTLLGISATRTSVIERQIARNDNIAKILFYSAEGAAHEAAQLMDRALKPQINLIGTLDKDTSSEFHWVIGVTVELDQMQKLYDKNESILNALIDGEYWEDEENEKSKDIINWQNARTAILSKDKGGTDLSTDARYLAIDYGPGSGDSAQMYTEKLYTYKILGRADRDERKKIVEIGFKRRF